MTSSDVMVATGSQVCPICSSPSWQEVYRFNDRSHHVNGCRQCGAQTILPYPTPEESAAFYNNWHTTRLPEEHVDFLIECHVQLFQALQKHIDFDLKSASFLEVGFGNGVSPLAAAKFGMREVYGVDLDPENVTDTEKRAAAQNLRVQCFRGDAVSGLPSGRRFRLVKASQLIEHLTNPAEFIHSVASRQDSGDYLYLECPNNAAAFLFFKNLLRERYDRMDFYNSMRIQVHLWGFRPSSMSQLLRRHGYEIVFCRSYRLRHPYVHPENILWYPTVGAGVQELLRARKMYSLLKSSIAAFDCLASLAGGGTELAALARKI